jgi:Alpha/beta hydrolase domain
MSVTKRLAGRLWLAAIVVAISAITVMGQLPIPVPGENNGGPGAQGQRGGGGQGGRGQRGAPAAPPAPMVVAPLATVSSEITGPGKFFETLMELKPTDNLAHFGYVTKEYFVSGMSNGQPYKTRIVIRKPADNSKFNGLILAESMHPSGNPWMFHFTHVYDMTNGVIGVEILTSTPAGFAAANPERYKDLVVPNGSANDIIAQVGALIKSKRADNPLNGLPVRKMILTGSSASAGVAFNFLANASMVQRLEGMKPIFDAFMPTSANQTIPPIDVPTILVPTQREVFQGNGTVQKDSDMPGSQLRVFEFAGMAHIDSRDAAAYYPDPCKMPISRFPMAVYMSVAMDYLFKWADKGVAPPHADRFYVDLNSDNDGSMFALDEVGNVKGGIRTTYVDVPVRSYRTPNQGADPRIPEPHPFIKARRVGNADPDDQLCGLANYEVPLTAAQLKKLYKDKKEYETKVQQSYDALVKQGWALPLPALRDVVMSDAKDFKWPGASSN